MGLIAFTINTTRNTIPADGLTINAQIKHHLSSLSWQAYTDSQRPI